MASTDLSAYDKTTVPSAKNMKFGIAVSSWNHEITNGLLEGCMQGLLDNGAKNKNIIKKNIPGTFELPLVAQFFFEKTDVDAVICIGSVIQGETKHFDFVCNSAALGIKDVAIKYNKPVIFGVLTDNNLQQAIDRSGGDKGNKGTEAAITAIQMVGLQQSF